MKNITNRRYKKYLFPVFLVVSCLAYVGYSEYNRTMARESVVPGNNQDAIAEKSVFRSVSGAEAMRILEQNPGMALLDVRTPQERHQMRITGSRLVPVGDAIRGRIDTGKDTPLLLICAVGGRSYVAAKVLSGQGYREVYNLSGGIEAWRKAGMPVEYGPELVPGKP